MNSEDTLKKYFGHDSFRDKQKEAIASLLANNNTLCLMPTGMGKSLIYQVTALLQGKTALVISPLLALMEQQSDVLNSHINKFGKTSVAFNSNSGNTLKQYKYLRDGFNPPENPSFIFVSPEKMMLDGYAEFVFRQQKSNIGLIVIDEAHCVSQWGHSFRPSYKMIPQFLKDIFGINIPPILCLTATINQIDKLEIIKDFKIEKTIVSDSLLRNNI
jgi:ATP-dependent DNA helicase RecQ